MTFDTLSTIVLLLLNDVLLNKSVNLTNPRCQFCNELEESVMYTKQQSPDCKYIVKEEVQRCGKVEVKPLGTTSLRFTGL